MPTALFLVPGPAYPQDVPRDFQVCSNQSTPLRALGQCPATPGTVPNFATSYRRRFPYLHPTEYGTVHGAPEVDDLHLLIPLELSAQRPMVAMMPTSKPRWGGSAR